MYLLVLPPSTDFVSNLASDLLTCKRDNLAVTFRLLGKDCNEHLLHGGHFGGGINDDAAAQQSKDAIIYVTVRERTQLS